MNLEDTMKASNVVAAVAGGLVLGAAVFLPIGANAINQEAKQIAHSQEKVMAPSSDQATSEVTAVDVQVDPAAVDMVAVDPTTDPTPTPVVTTPTFSAGDDGDSQDEHGEDGDSHESESDD
jgi:hypothetical protein